MTGSRKNLRPEPKPPSPLKAERLLRGWDMEQVASFVGTSVASLSRYEAGSHAPSVTLAARFSDLYGKPIEDLWPVEDAA